MWVLYKMPSPYYVGGLGIPYMMGMGGLGLFFPLFCYTLAQRYNWVKIGYGLGASMYGMGMGMGMGMNTGMLSPYGMAATNPYAYTGMVCFSDTHYKEVLI